MPIYQVNKNTSNPIPPFYSGTGDHKNDDHLVIWFSNGDILHGDFIGYEGWNIGNIRTLNSYLSISNSSAISKDGDYYPIHTIVKFGMFTDAQIIQIKRGEKLDKVLS